MSKTVFSVLRPLAAILIVFLVGLRGVGAATFAGTYQGTYSGGDSGTWLANIASTGAISLTVYSSAGETMTGTGQAAANGSLTMTAGSISGGSTFTGTINSTTGGISGTWTNSYYGMSGGFSGSMSTTTGNYAGTYSGTFSGDDSGPWTASISSTGALSLQIYSNKDGATYTGSGQVSADGTISGGIGSGASFTGAISPITSAFSGTWSNSYYGVKGTILAFRPFNVVVSGGVTGKTASLSTTIKVNANAVGKQGAVFVTARVPQSTLASASGGSSPLQSRSTPRAGETSPTFVQVQLVSGVWQQVVNGQLLPYATGLLGDQLGAQNILNGTDITNLAGSQFCVGYGTSAEQMLAAGTIQAVLSIQDSSGATAVGANCVADSATTSYNLDLSPGWNLLGNGLNQAIAVASQFGDPASVISVWKWDALKQFWYFYTPSLDAAGLQNYANSKGYRVLGEIKPGEGFWVNAKAQLTLGARSGYASNLTAAGVVSGWNLAATANNPKPAELNAILKARLPETGATTMWAWDAGRANWYFYAPSLDEQGGTALATYITNKGYLDFATNGKSFSPGVGFWLNMP